MAKTRKRKTPAKIDYRIDPTRVHGKKGVQYEWTVLRGLKDLEHGICKSYGAAEREAFDAVRRHQEAEITGDESKAKKAIKLGSFLNPQRKRQP
jgi:hypothetical protein